MPQHSSPTHKSALSNFYIKPVKSNDADSIDGSDSVSLSVESVTKSKGVHGSASKLIEDTQPINRESYLETETQKEVFEGD